MKFIFLNVINLKTFQYTCNSITFLSILTHTKLASYLWDIGKQLDLNEPRCEKTGLRGFRPDLAQNRAVQSYKMVRCLKFLFKEEEVFYYPCSENKGADQLRGYREADLRLCFRICKKPVFL